MPTTEFAVDDIAVQLLRDFTQTFFASFSGFPLPRRPSPSFERIFAFPLPDMGNSEMVRPLCDLHANLLS